VINGVIDAALVYAFIKRLVTPFDKWKAFQTGTIDKDGNILVAPNRRTLKQRESFGMYDVMCLNMKKLLATIPGGSSKFGTYAAALYLTLEPKPIVNESVFTEFVDKLQLTDEVLLYYEDAPTNSIGTGNIAIQELPIIKKIIRRKKNKDGRIPEDE